MQFNPVPQMLNFEGVVKNLSEALGRRAGDFTGFAKAAAWQEWASAA